MSVFVKKYPKIFASASGACIDMYMYIHALKAIGTKAPFNGGFAFA